jgi:hypothetical protein
MEHLSLYGVVYVDDALRSMNTKTLSKALTAGKSYLALSQLSDGDYSVRLNNRLEGGGLLGTSVGCFLGKAIVSVVGHGAIALVSAGVSLVATPAAGYITATALESVFGPAIESLSMVGAVSGGIVVGACTGPV